MTPDDISAAASALVEAERTNTQMRLISGDHPGMDMDAAYAVQARVVAAKEAAGAKRIGWKIGLTSRAMQQALGIDIPDSGVLFDDMHFETGGRVPAGRFIEPRVEAEIAFVLKSDIAGAATRAEVLAATDYVCPSLEILDTRILRRDPDTGATRKVFDTIADNAANAGVVLGAARHAPDAHDLAWVGALVRRDGVVEETGLGGGVLGDPVQGLVWLSERLETYGDVMRAGDIVLSGSFIRPIECPPGSSIDADFGAFGQVSISFD
ncbi:MAG: 2-oxo-hepta-3-ene-1,7-dioic acid hydratase [Pseudomonadota bacterium]